MFQNQGSNCRKLRTSDDNLIQQVEGKKEDGDNESDQMRSDQANIHDFDGDQYSFTQNIQTKDKTNNERLSDAEMQQDTHSSSPHPSDRLKLIPPSPPLHHDISKNRNNRNCTTMKGNNNYNTLEEPTGSQIPIPISKNAPTKDQAVEERQQKQDTSNDKKPPYVQEDDYRTKVRNRAQNRCKNTAEQNKKRQEEITRLIKANF